MPEWISESISYTPEEKEIFASGCNIGQIDGYYSGVKARESSRDIKIEFPADSYFFNPAKDKIFKKGYITGWELMYKVGKEKG